MDLLFFAPLPPLDPLALLAQVAPPPDAGSIDRYVIYVLLLGLIGLFGLYTKKIIDGEKEWKATAKEASAEFPKMATILEKAVEAGRTQQTLIEAQVRDISQLKDTVSRVERHLDDLRLSIKAVPPSRRRTAGEEA